MFEQYLFTDNKQGYGLSVLNKSPGIPKALLNRLDGYASYEAPLNVSKETTPEAFNDAHRYNCSFAKAPLLMNTAYIGKEITTGRNRNFAVHTLISDAPLKNYAVDYFAEERQLFVKSFKLEEVDGSNPNPMPLATIPDEEIFQNTNIQDTVNAINKDIKLFSNILQATILSSIRDGWIKMVNYDNPLEILKMLYYIFPVKIANQITFNTRAYSNEKLISSDITFDVNGRNETRTCVFGSVELVQFYNTMWSKSGGEATYTFYNDAENFSFDKYFAFIDWFQDKGGITAEKIEIFKELITEKGYRKLSDLISIEYDALVSFAIERKQQGYRIAMKQNSEAAVKKEQQTEVAFKPMITEVKKPTAVNYEEPKKKRKIKLSIVNIIATCLVLTLCILGASKLIKNGGDNILGEKSYFVINNEEIEISDWNEGKIPNKNGYDFNGYVDADGNVVINADGKINSNYQLDKKNKIILTEKWTAKDNNITIVCQGDNISFVCKTDESIVISQENLNALINSGMLHMEFQGLALSESGELIYKKSFDGVYRFNSPYGTMSSVAYSDGIENSSLTLYPVYAPQTMEFHFADYYTKQTIATESIVYSEQGAVPLDSFLNRHPEYSDCNIYIQSENDDSFIEIYTKAGKWNGQQGKLNSEKYQSGNVTLYVSRRVNIFWGTAAVADAVNYGDDLQALAISKLAENNYSNFKFSNAIYYAIGNSKEYKFTENAASVWSDLGSETRVYIYPAYRIAYKFHVFNVSSMRYEALDNISAETRIKFPLSAQTPSVEYIGYSGNETPIQNLIYNDFEIATALTQRWISDLQMDDYFKISNCLLYSDYTQANLGYVIENRKINPSLGFDYLSDVNETNNIINLYSAYNPSNIVVKFDKPASSADLNKNITFGSKLRVPSYQNASWGYEYVSWKSNNKNLSPNNEVLVDFQFLDGVKKSSGVLFEAVSKAYEFKITLTFDKNKYTYTVKTDDSVSVGSEWTINNKNAKSYYEDNYYNNLSYKYVPSTWTEDWYILDKDGNSVEFDLSNGIIKIEKGVLEDYVQLNSVNESVELSLTKKIENRRYVITFNDIVYEANNREIGPDSNLSVLKDSTYTANSNSVKFDKDTDSITLPGCKDITVSEWGSKTTYTFVGWYINKDIVKKANSNSTVTILVNDEFLKSLYKTGGVGADGAVTVSITPIFIEKEESK